MKKGNMRTIILFAILCLMLSSFPGCHKETEQDKVKKVITNIQKAAEEKDIKKIINSISKTYNDPQGNNYGNMNGLIIAYFYQYPEISIYLPQLDVSVNDASAEAIFEAVLTSKGAAVPMPAILPESLGVYAFDVFFKKESDGWKVVSAKWEQLGNPDNL
jgi:hypothetical protein